MKYVLATDYDEECFDYDGVGDYVRTSTNYIETDTKEELLAYLKRNIFYEDRKTKPKLDTVEGYCKEFGFRLYKQEV